MPWFWNPYITSLSCEDATVAERPVQCTYSDQATWSVTCIILTKRYGNCRHHKISYLLLYLMVLYCNEVRGQPFAMLGVYFFFFKKISLLVHADEKYLSPCFSSPIEI